jgi:hypothetical protein
MLGKVFENLLEEIERDKSGVFYTPRPIVHYMCRESLIGYLEDRTGLAEEGLRELLIDQESYALSAREAARVEQALSEIRVVDPAVGSGAFLVGMLQMMVQVRRACKVARQAEIARTGSEVAGWKRDFIQQSLYGVDIKPEAVEIARLRLWLSLVVDLETRVPDVEPLPNLDYRIVSGNSLLESFDQQLDAGGARSGRLDLESGHLLALRRTVAEEREAYFTETDPARKVAARRAIDEQQTRLQEQWLRDRLQDLRRESEHLIANLAAGGGKRGAAHSAQRIQERINRLQSLLQRTALGNQLPLSYRVSFSEVFDRGKPGFDIVIANPPYVNVQRVNGLDYVAELKAAYGWLDDLYAHFLFRGFDLAREGGIIAYITADTYLTIGTKQRLRDLLLQNRLTVLARCDPFDATVDTAVLLARKQTADADDALFFANGNRRKAAAFDDLGPVNGWAESREVQIGDERRTVLIGPAEPLPQYIAPLLLYRRALKRAFFEPSPFNLALYERFMPAMRSLYDTWWPRIATSAAMAKNTREVEKYCTALKPGDITLLGLVTEGGVGLQTSDNPRFLAHLEGTEWGDKDERN